MNFTDIVDAIKQERARQEQLWNREHSWGTGDCSSPAVPMIVKAVVLGEECGEVMQAVLDLDDDALRTELVQVAAVAVAILEGL